MVVEHIRFSKGQVFKKPYLDQNNPDLGILFFLDITTFAVNY